MGGAEIAYHVDAVEAHLEGYAGAEPIVDARGDDNVLAVLQHAPQLRRRVDDRGCLIAIFGGHIV